LRIIFCSKGISLVEVMIAMFLTTIAVISILPMQDMSLRTASRSDYLGRATGIMQAELEARENQIMIGTIPASPIPPQTITVSGFSGAIDGDVTFNVVTTIGTNPLGANSWLVNVRVTWTGRPANGISSSMIVTKQSRF
jgi:Tfp pilus assembly protein PilV